MLKFLFFNSQPHRFPRTSKSNGNKDDPAGRIVGPFGSCRRPECNRSVFCFSLHFGSGLADYLIVCSSAATKTVLSQADADEIGAACPTFTGNILLGDGPPYSRIALNGIQEITGKLTIEDWMWVSGDSLTRVGGSLENINSFTEEISFPALEYVGGGIIFTEVDQYKVSLQRALFPSLKEVNGDLIITGNHYFHELEVPNIERINGLLKLYDERQIASLTMNKLESVGPGGIEIAGYFE